jgi:hypothetical protein
MMLTFQYMSLESKVALRNSLRNLREKVSDGTMKNIFGVETKWDCVDAAINQMTKEINEEVK